MASYNDILGKDVKLGDELMLGDVILEVKDIRREKKFIILITSYGEFVVHPNNTLVKYSN